MSVLGLGRVNEKKVNFRDNWKFVDKECVYCMMDYFTNIGDLGKNIGISLYCHTFRLCLSILVYQKGNKESKLFLLGFGC